MYNRTQRIHIFSFTYSHRDIKTKCLSVLLYGLEVCSLTKADQRSLDFAVIRFLMKLFCTSNMVIINACLSYFDFRLPSELLLKRYEKYLVKRVFHSCCCRCVSLSVGLLCSVLNYELFSYIYKLYEL